MICPRGWNILVNLDAPGPGTQTCYEHRHQVTSIGAKSQPLMVRRQFRKVTSGEESPINQQKSQWRGRFKIIMQHQEIIPKRAHSVELSLFGDTLWHGVQTMPLCELSGQSLQTSTVRTIYLVRQCKTLWALEKFF